MMTEPDLVTIGDNACVDNASLISHINTRGIFKSVFFVDFVLTFHQIESNCCWPQLRLEVEHKSSFGKWDGEILNTPGAYTCHLWGGGRGRDGLAGLAFTSSLSFERTQGGSDPSPLNKFSS